MDPFSSLDAFLQDPNESASQLVGPNDEAGTSFDDSLTDTLPKKTKKGLPSNKATKKSVDAERVLDLDKKSKKFVPGKGQKMAFKKLEKIKGLVPIEVEPVIKPTKKRSTRSSRQTRSRQQREYNSDSDDDAFETDQRSKRAREPLPAYVNLDSDDEYAETPISINRNLASDSTALQTSENDEMKVVVKFCTKLEEYMLRPFQKLSDLIAELAQRKSINANKIFLMLNGKIVLPSNSLRSIDYIPGLVICAHVAEQTANANHNNSKTSKTINHDEIELKIQTALRKKPFAVHIGKFDKISNLVFQCAEEFKCDPKKVRLEFDGELLDSNKTAEHHDLEGGEMIDMFISKS